MKNAWKTTLHHLENILQSAGTGTWEWNAASGEITVQGCWFEALGYSLAELLPWDITAWQKQIHPDDQLAATRLLGQKRPAPNDSAVFTCRLLHKNGQWSYFLVQGSVQLDKAGKLCRCSAVLTDITKLTAERKSHEEFSRFFSLSQDLLCMVTVDATILRTNPAWANAFGYLPEEIQGRKFTDFMHPEDIAPTLALMGRLRPGKSEKRHTNRYRYKDGSFRYIEWSAEIYDGLVYASGRDITVTLQQAMALQTNLRMQEAHLSLMNFPANTPAELIDKALEQILALSASKFGFIYLYDETAQAFILQSYSAAVLPECQLKAPPQGFLAHTGLWAEIVQQHKPVIHNAYPAGKRRYPEGHLPIKNFLAIPVLDQDRVVAVVGVANKDSDYTDADICNLERLMNVVWSRLERKKSEEMLTREHSLFWATLFSLQEGIITTDAAGKITLLNQAAEELTGWALPHAVGEPFDKIFPLYHAENREKIIGPVEKVLTTGKVVSPLSGNIMLLRDGSERYINGSISPAVDNSGAIIGAVINFHDITVFWQKQQKDAYLLQHDALTGAFSRQFAQQKFTEEMARSDRYGQALSMLMLDVDYFKKINDTWGHPVGDAVLKQTVAIIKKSIRQTDTLIRMGGEEFVILMPQTNLQAALITAEKIRQLIEKTPYPPAGQVTASFGVAERLPRESFDHWYKRVDSALYLAKTDGRNRVRINNKQAKKSHNLILLPWQDEWNSGHPLIDAQHRELLEDSSQLISLALAGAKATAIDKQLNRLLGHLEKHFSDEIAVLREAGYPEQEAHAKTHAELLAKAANMKAADPGKNFKSSAFFSFAADDLILGHMLHDDIQFFPYLQLRK